jgi:excisionase family DNA binding protein
LNRYRPHQLHLFAKEVGVRRAALILRCSDDTVIRLIEDGSLKAYRLRRRGPYRIAYESIKEYVLGLRKEYIGDDPDSDFEGNSASSADAARSLG